MNLILSQIESQPEAYPAVEGVSGDALAMAWQRVEHYTKQRFASRAVVWTVQGDTSRVWYAPLGPIISIEGEIIDGGVPFTPTPCGIGWWLPNGPVSLMAIVGAGPVPAAVSTAVRRLANYYDADVPIPGGVRSYSLNVGDMSESMTVVAGRFAKAMQESGAADLLRPYRSSNTWLS